MKQECFMSSIYYTSILYSFSNDMNLPTLLHYIQPLNMEVTIMPASSILLSVLEPNTQGKIVAMSGSDQRLQILRRMGFVEGSLITLLEKTDGNLLVQNEDSRIIMSHRLAQAIQVELT